MPATTAHGGCGTKDMARWTSKSARLAEGTRKVTALPPSCYYGNNHVFKKKGDSHNQSNNIETFISLSLFVTVIRREGREGSAGLALEVNRASGGWGVTPCQIRSNTTT